MDLVDHSPFLVRREAQSGVPNRLRRMRTPAKGGNHERKPTETMGFATVFADAYRGISKKQGFLGAKSKKVGGCQGTTTKRTNGGADFDPLGGRWFGSCFDGDKRRPTF